MNIGVLIICTGKYHIFFKDLYESCEKFFLPDHKKTYYVFTDSDVPVADNIKKIEQPFLGFPFDTMMRYKMFSENKSILEKEDYLFFLNANMLCTSLVGEEIIPTEQNDYLMAVQHPGYAGRNIDEYTYERNARSNFYIPYGKGKYYYQGNFNGGRSLEFLEMSQKLSALINNDLSKGITPIWHDESALNWYLLNKNPLMASTQYATPEGWGIQNVKIMNRDKNKFGGYTYLRTAK
jgi:hypothetical protein